MSTTPILMLGAGRMGGAMLAGWLRAGAFAPSDIIVRDPNAKPVEGVRLNPSDAVLGEAKTVVLAVKPQLWRGAAAEIADLLAPDAVIVSVAAGVRAADISQALGGRRVARAMPTTAAAINQGTASLYADDAEALARARALFRPLGAVVELPEEELIHLATAVSGSAPAYLYAFVEALEAAGEAAGLAQADAQVLARSTLAGAAALMVESGENPAELRRQVTSPNGTTQAALNVLMADEALPSLLRQAVAAAAKRSEELGA
jgi:pyrroline-5-carboxylate reductase